MYNAVQAERERNFSNCTVAIQGRVQEGNGCVMLAYKQTFPS